MLIDIPQDQVENLAQAVWERAWKLSERRLQEDREAELAFLAFLADELTEGAKLLCD